MLRLIRTLRSHTEILRLLRTYRRQLHALSDSLASVSSIQGRKMLEDSEMDEVSENHVIGSFLYGLRLQIGLNAPNRNPLPTYVGNNQTLRLDECYGDVILKNASLLRIIKFKRQAERRDYKEAAKLVLLEEGLNCAKWSDEDRKMLRRVSRKIHLLVESPKNLNPETQFGLYPTLIWARLELTN